jgi:hypothetical protein
MESRTEVWLKGKHERERNEVPVSDTCNWFGFSQATAPGHVAVQFIIAHFDSLLTQK